MKTRILMAMGLLSLSGLAWGQICSQGIPSAGNPMCVPPDPNNPNAPNYRGNQAPTASVIPQVRWADRWGAIAIDDQARSGGIGTVIGMRSKRQAQKVALAQCRASGGEGCQIKLVYSNQCGVIAWGDRGYTAIRAATIEHASQRAIQICSEANTNCRIYYADCSLPERIQ